MKSLYRRYRPLKLSDVVGQEQVTKVLENSLKQGKTSHAYLFVGPRGCGKTSVARILAHELNGFPYEIEDDYVDIIEIDGASNRGIDNIRELREKVAIAPTKGKYKVYIIDEVHMLTKEAFNALLKTLEEPPAHAIFIMATTDAYKVPVTITSRAQTYTFKLASADVMFDFLKSVAQKEKINIEDEALKIVAKRGGGSFRDSLSLLDQISTISDGKITRDLVVSAMGLPQTEKIAELLNKYAASDTSGIAADLKDLWSSGIKPETLAEEMISCIIENPKAEYLPLLEKITEVRPPFAAAKLLVALSAQTTLSASITAPREVATNKPTVQPTTTAQPEKHEQEEAPRPTINSDDFNWDSFLASIKDKNDAIYAQLLKTKHRIQNGCLDIYPEKRVVKTILSRENNKRILIDETGGAVKVIIHEAGENPPEEKKDQILTKISDIMGGEVTNDGGASPF